MSELIELQNVNFSYKKNTIYEDLNLTINQGDVLAVLGHNGAGKTTLLKIMAGLLKIKFGKIQRNIDFSEIGFMNEELGLYPFLNAKENIELVLLRHNKKYSKENIENLLQDYKLTDEKKMVSEYSTGMKKKLSFLCVFLKDSKLFLLDEPFTGCDPIAQNFLINQIKEKSSEQNAFVIVNHDLPSTMKMCNKFLIIKEGKVVFYSDKQEDINDLENIYSKYSE